MKPSSHKLLFAYTHHTEAIWTFTFHKISGFVRVILKANFKPAYRLGLCGPKLIVFNVKKMKRHNRNLATLEHILTKENNLKIGLEMSPVVPIP